MNVSRHKTGIPQPVSKKSKNGSDSRSNSAREMAEHDDQQQPNSARDPLQMKASSQRGPLAAALTKKSTAKKNQM